jgi:hypothetical protein
MARAYSSDLRVRVIEAINSVLSTRQAARFAIGIGTAGRGIGAGEGPARSGPGPAHKTEYFWLPRLNESGRFSIRTAAQKQGL